MNRRSRRGSRSTALDVGAAGALVLALAPFVWLALQGAPTWPGARGVGLLGHSLALGLAVAALAGLLGTGAAVGIATRGDGLARGARALFLLPLLAPPYAVAVAWSSLLGRGGPLQFFSVTLPSPTGLPGAVFVLAGTTAPLVTLFVLAALDDLDPRQVDAARIHGDPWRLWTHGVLPQIGPAAGTGAALAFCLALGEHAAPALVQFPVFATEIHAELAATGDVPAAARLGTALVWPGVVALAVAQWADRRRPLLGRRGGVGGRVEVPVPGVLKWGAGACTAGVVVGVLAPLVGLGWWAARPEGVAAAWALVGRPLGDSLLVGAMAAVLAVAAAGPLAALLAGEARPWLRLLTLLPLALPPSLYGLAAMGCTAVPGLAALAQTPVALAAAHAGRLMPIALVVLLLHLRRLDPRLADVASLARSRLDALGARAAALAPGLAAAAAAVLALSLAELDASLVLAPPGHGTLSVTLFNLLHHGAGDAAAAGTLMAITAAWAAWAAGGWALTRRPR